jgi:hypothetical protein
MDFPSAVRGPVERLALILFDSSCLGEQAIGATSEGI